MYYIIDKEEKKEKVLLCYPKILEVGVRIEIVVYIKSLRYKLKESITFNVIPFVMFEDYISAEFPLKTKVDVTVSSQS